MDVITIDDMKRDIERTPVLSENFYSIVPVMKGREKVSVNERSAIVGTGNVAFREKYGNSIRTVSRKATI